MAEGEITATEAGRAYSEKDGMIQVINVGGIVGSLVPDMGGYDDYGNPTEPGTEPVVKDCLVALAAITIPEDNEALLATAHRIVGRSRVNYDPKYLGEEYDEDLEDWAITWGDPGPRELPRQQLCHQRARLARPVDSRRRRLHRRRHAGLR